MEIRDGVKKGYSVKDTSQLNNSAANLYMNGKIGDLIKTIEREEADHDIPKKEEWYPAISAKQDE